MTYVRPSFRLLKFDPLPVDEARARQFGRRLQRLTADDRELVEDLIEVMIALRAGAGERKPALAKEVVRDLSVSIGLQLFDALEVRRAS